MSSQQQPSNNHLGLVQKVCNAPRVKRVISRWQNTFSNVYNKYNNGARVSKENAYDTLNEMKKFYSPTEIKTALDYSKTLAKETHEELIGSKVRLMSETFRTVFEAQINSIFKSNNFAIDEDDSSDDPK